jgi:formylglycine-generating enzyme required for sulfatase activity
MVIRASLALVVAAAVALCASTSRVARSAERAASTIPATRSVALTIAASDFGHGRGPGLANLDLVRLPAGKITLTGKDGVAREYDIKPIWIGRTEVTWEQYDIFWMGLDMRSPWEGGARLAKARQARSRPSVPYTAPDQDWGHAGFPAITLTFEAADSFCSWLSTHTGKKFRVPTEAEWEYACRAGGPPVKFDKAEDLKAVAWFSANSDEQTRAVAKLKPNAWGLYDMLGNAAEYVIVDEKTRDYRVAGGSFRDKAANVHSGAREAYDKEWQHRDPQEPKGRSWLSDGQHVGLRVVMEE